MKQVSLGGLDVSRIGLGTMAMSGYYLDPSSSDAESIRTIQRALDLGVTHIDTAEIYGPYANEEHRPLLRREHGCGRDRAECGADPTARRSPPGDRRAPRRGEHVHDRPLTA
jgi:aryl-alcohol dehydrogenase-like predicted oxidoreductase